MQGDVHEPAILADPYGRQTRNRRLHLAVTTDDAQTAGPLADQHVAIRKEFDAPRGVQIVGDRVHAEGLLLAGDSIRKRAGPRRRAGACPLLRFTDVDDQRANLLIGQ
jgi:hypothetical protein